MDAFRQAAPAALRILVLTRSYPSESDLYQYPFVHRRVLAYRAAGHDVSVFRLKDGRPEAHEYEGVTCRSGDSAAFCALANDFSPDVIAAHGLSEALWSALEGVHGVPMRVWLHGSEIPAFFRRKAEAIADSVARASAMAEVEARAAFWLNLFDEAPADLKLIFPSHAAVEMMRADCGDALRSGDYEVIPNPIDTSLFGYDPKCIEDRLSILSIRPYDSSTYANDLSVAAVVHLSQRPDFGRLRFTFIGNGPLFEQTLAPIAGLANVEIRRGFLPQSEIAREHRHHGVFLVPTRLDTHGVSRDEAMASGLVPATNALPVVREFVDSDCAALAPPEDALTLADEISRMIDEPALFLRRSRAAAERVRKERGHERVIPAELELLADRLSCEAPRRWWR